MIPGNPEFHVKVFDMKNSVLIQNVTSDDLKEIISDVIEAQLKGLTHQPKESSEYLTREETADLLRISLPTLFDYTKKGYIKGHRIGSRVLYRRDQLEDSLKEIQTQKYRRA